MKRHNTQHEPASAIISSRQHSLCRLVRSLHSAKGRREQGLFLIEGANSVGAALRAQWPLQRVLVADDAAGAQWSHKAHAAQIPVQTVTAHLMEYMSEAQTPTDVLALAALPQTNFDAAASPRDRAHRDRAHLVLALDGVGDPGNVGTLLRTADVAGVTQCVLSPESADAYGPKAVRASAGSIFHLQVTSSTQQAMLQELHMADLPLVTAVAHGGENCFGFKWPRRCCLVLGHETRGVSAMLDDAAAHRVTIPNYGRAESLNVAAAGAVLLFAWRQRVEG
ncbi:MAG TPA: RNA methyltransferase [Abditibacteriaceae bacterium]